MLGDGLTKKGAMAKKNKTLKELYEEILSRYYNLRLSDVDILCWQFPERAISLFFYDTLNEGFHSQIYIFDSKEDGYCAMIVPRGFPGISKLMELANRYKAKNINGPIL